MARKVKDPPTNTDPEALSTDTPEGNGNTDTETPENPSSNDATDGAANDDGATDEGKEGKGTSNDPVADLTTRVDELTTQVAALVGVSGGGSEGGNTMSMLDVRRAVAEALQGQQVESKLETLEAEVLALKEGNENGRRPRSALAAFILGNR